MSLRIRAKLLWLLSGRVISLLKLLLTSCSAGRGLMPLAFDLCKCYVVLVGFSIGGCWFKNEKERGKVSARPETLSTRKKRKGLSLAVYNNACRPFWFCVQGMNEERYLSVYSSRKVVATRP